MASKSLEVGNNMNTDAYVTYKAAALTGLLAGLAIEPKNQKEEVSNDDLIYLELLCDRIAQAMVKG